MAEEDDSAQSVDISLSTDDLPDLVDTHGVPIDTARHLNLTLNLTIRAHSQTLTYTGLLQMVFHRDSHLDRYESLYKVGSAATGLEAMGQHLDRCPCFKNDKV